MNSSVAALAAWIAAAVLAALRSLLSPRVSCWRRARQRPSLLPCWLCPAVPRPSSSRRAGGRGGDVPALGRRAVADGFRTGAGAHGLLAVDAGRAGEAGWLFGAAASLIGALGVFGLSNGAGLLIAWEIMSFGGAAMIFGKAQPDPGGRFCSCWGCWKQAPWRFWRRRAAGGGQRFFSFAAFVAAAPVMPFSLCIPIAVLLVIGFGAKLRLLPFYEWSPPRQRRHPEHPGRSCLAW